MFSRIHTGVLAVSLAIAAAAAADVFVDTPGPNNLDTIVNGESIAVGITSGSTPVNGVIATNTVIKSWDSLYSWSNSVVYLNNAAFTGFDMQAHDTSTIHYQGGVNSDLSLVTFDDAVINISGGEVGFVGTGGGSGSGGSVNISGGTITQLVSCRGGSVSITGGNFLLPTYGLDYSFFSEVLAGVAFSGVGLTAEFVGVESSLGPDYDGNVWKLGGTLTNGGSLNGLYMVDVGVFDSAVIRNYTGLTIIPGPGALALLAVGGCFARRRRC